MAVSKAWKWSAKYNALIRTVSHLLPLCGSVERRSCLIHSTRLMNDVASTLCETPAPSSDMLLRFSAMAVSSTNCILVLP